MKKSVLLLYCLLSIYFSHAQSTGWKTITNAPVVTRFDDVSFVDSLTGWISQGDKIYKTTDGGESWHQIGSLPLSGYVRSIEFINDTLGFLGTLYNNSNAAALYRTTNGGVTWADISASIPNFGTGACGIAHHNNTIIATGVYDYSSRNFYKSDDGGNTWTTTDLSAYASGLVDCYAIDDNNYLLSGNATAADGERAVILRTSDGGSSWQQVALCSATGFSYIWKMFFLSGGLGYASVEEKAIIMKTTDYGVTWNEIHMTLNATGPASLGAIGALNDSIIWAGRQFSEGMYGTTDGGTTWRYYAHFAANMDRMTAIDADHLICVGKTVYKYTNGSTFVPNEPSTTLQHHSVTVHPNPAKENLTVNLKIFQSTSAVIDVIDISGKTAKHLFNGGLAAGDSDHIYSVKDLAAGNYTLLFRSNEEFIQKNFQVIH